MAKPLTSWLVPSFWQPNLRLVVSGCCLHVSVTKFQDKFASLRQVNSPYRRNKFHIFCTDMFLIRFLPNFAVFFVFLWISRDFADLAPRPHEISEALAITPTTVTKPTTPTTTYYTNYSNYSNYTNYFNYSNYSNYSNYTSYTTYTNYNNYTCNYTSYTNYINIYYNYTNYSNDTNYTNYINYSNYTSYTV